MYEYPFKESQNLDGTQDYDKLSVNRKNRVWGGVTTPVEDDIHE